MADAAMPKVGDKVADKYEIEALIGEGGMGSVFRARHRITGKQVALKWMLPELARNEDAVHRFLREAKAAGRIAHPNVVDIYDVGEHQASYFLVMEYLHGEPLTELLSRGALAPEQIADILIPCMQGVAAAHKKGVIHRDLKPDNIFLCRNDEGVYLQPKVLDFGISKLAGIDNEVNPRLTRTGAVMGTPYYMSPEQIRGSHDVDGRCDIYAFGVILYEALTGRVPFRAESYSALVLEIATGTPAMPKELNPSLSDGLQDVLMRAMAREPRDRYQDISLLAAALEPFAGAARYTSERLDPTTGISVQTGGGSRTSTPFSTENSLAGFEVPRRSSRPLWVALGALLVLGGAVGWLMLAGDKGAAEDVADVDNTEKAAEKEVEPSAGGKNPAGSDSTAAGRAPTAEDEVVNGVVPGVGATPSAEADKGAGVEAAVEAAADSDAPAAAEDEPKDDAAPVRKPSRSKPRVSSNGGPTKTTKPATPAESSSDNTATPAKPSAGGKQGSGRTGRLTVDDF